MHTTQALQPDVAQAAQSIGSLPPLPANVAEILGCFGDEFIDADKVARVVENDPGICAKLLGLSNSAYFGSSQPVVSIREAISRVLGVDTVRSLVLAMAMQQSFDSSRCAAFDAGQFWMQALMASNCCKKIAAGDDTVTAVERELAGTAGLCHNLGLMALAHLEPERTNDALQAHAAGAKRANLSSLLAAQFGFDHRAITAELARLWSLPEPMVTAYAFRAAPDNSAASRLGQIVISAATAVSDSLASDEPGLELKDGAAKLGLDASNLQAMATPGERQLNRMRSLSATMTG